MLAQSAPSSVGQLAPVIAWLVGLVAVFGPGARGITWIVDRERDLLPFGDDPRYKVLWALSALAFALVSCLLFQINVVGGILQQTPRFTSSTVLAGTWGQVVTAVGLAGFSSSWHDRDQAAALRRVVTTKP